MKRATLLFVGGLFATVLISATSYLPNDQKSASLTIVSSAGDSVVVSFDAAYIVGDATSTTPLTVTTLTTPLRLEIDSPHFMGIFKKKSGNGNLVVSLSKPQVGNEQYKGTVVCVSMVKEKIQGSQF